MLRSKLLCSRVISWCEQGCEPKLPTQQQASREAQLAVQFQNEDPGGRYDMSVKPIGQGGMGIIYLGQDRRTDRRVAVKKLSLAKNTDMKALHNEIAMMQAPHRATSLFLAPARCLLPRRRVTSPGRRRAST